MRRLILFAAGAAVGAAVLSVVAMSAAVSSASSAMTSVRAARVDAPLCLLSPEFESALLERGVSLGAAVYDLRTGTVWSGGWTGPYAMHSTIKTPIAFAVMAEAQESGRELSEEEQGQLTAIITWSSNDDVDPLLESIDGLPGLAGFYERWGVSGLETAPPGRSWGDSRAEPSQLVRLYGALAMSEAIPQEAREDGFGLLRRVEREQIWGATIPEGELSGWESLIKTGNYLIFIEADGEESEGVELLLEPEFPEEDDGLMMEPEFPEEGEAERLRAVVSEVVRMNSAAIWLSPAAEGGEPRYAVAIMQESELTWQESRSLQDEVGRLLGEAIARRESGGKVSADWTCLRRALA